jgi:hypothetical protein
MTCPGASRGKVLTPDFLLLAPRFFRISLVDLLAKADSPDSWLLTPDFFLIQRELKNKLTPIPLRRDQLNTTL